MSFFTEKLDDVCESSCSLWRYKGHSESQKVNNLEVTGKCTYEMCKLYPEYVKWTIAMLGKFSNMPSVILSGAKTEWTIPVYFTTALVW